jgi:F0F1-type ATP synthase assembly protein I
VREPEVPGGEESTMQAMARFSGHGLTIALSTGLFLLAGWWVDGRLGTTPLLTVIGALLGAAAGFYSLLQHMVFFPREQEARERKAEEQGARERDDAGMRDPDAPEGDEGPDGPERS